MPKFKPGDKVRSTGNHFFQEGKTYTVTHTELYGGCVKVCVNPPDGGGWHYESCWERVTDSEPSALIAVQSESQRRKSMPLFQGCLMYFPDALLAISEHSRKANDKHNPGEPLHWSKDKSKDHADCIARHLVDIGPTWDAKDPEFDSLHATALAWRALALLQTVLERQVKKDSV